MNRKLEVGLCLAMVIFTLGFIFFNTSNSYQNYVSSYSSSSLPSEAKKFLANYTGDKTKISGHTEAESFEDRLARILSEVGGDPTVDIYPVPNACGVDAYACVLIFDTNTIQFDELGAFAADSDLRAAVAHELGHVVNNRMPLDSYLKYMVPFGFDREYFADCMAVARVGYTISDYGFTCTAEQVSLAAEAWTWYDEKFN